MIRKVIKFPPGCVNEGSRMSYCLGLQEKLRLENNDMGIKRKSEEITKSQWELYLSDNFDPKSDAIVNELLKQKDIAKGMPFWKPNLNTDIVDK